MDVRPTLLAVLLLPCACSNGAPGGAEGRAGSGGSDGAPQGGAAHGGSPAIDGSHPSAGSGGAGAPSRSAGCDARTPLAPGETTRTIRVGAVDRTYLLHVPPGYTGEATTPLVLDFHFLFGTGQAQRGVSGYAELSDREGFIVAFPDGIDEAWNIGPCCTFSRDVDDRAFALALVEELESEACVDPRRVYATGYSMGGGMSYFLACTASDTFAAITPAAFDLLEEMPCTPARPIPVLSFRGTADDLVLYEGGPSNPPNGLATTIHFKGAEATLAYWAESNGCAGDPSADANGCVTFADCDGASEVGLCTATGGGHEAGDAELGWAFLARHAMR